MSIESITKRIEDEARAYAQQQTAAAESDKNDILADARKQAESISADAKARADKDSKILVERRESVAGLESRKMQLKAKQEVIAESFDQALQKLLSMPESDYLGFMSAQLKPFESQGGEIMLNAADNKKYASKLSAATGKLTLSKDIADIKGGFILKQGDITINCSIEKLLEDKKEEMMADIAGKLFPNA